MQPHILSPLNKIPPTIWQIICTTVSVVAFSLILLNRQPGFLRETSISARLDFLPIIPLLALIVYLIFRIPGRPGELLAMTATMSLFALPVAGLWASGHTHTTALSGVIPLGDAKAYYLDALGLPSGVDFSSFSARRPLYSGLLAVFLSITNYNLMVSLAIFTALVGLASYLAIREIQRTSGTEVSVFVLMMIFLFFRLHSGTNMTENLGTSLGLLGFVMLWRGATDKRLWYILFGLLTTTLALNARAGAFFVLPFFIFWAGWVFRGDKRISWKTMIMSTCAVILGFVLNLMLTRLISTTSGVPFANFSFSLYGLASGGNSWFYVYGVHPELYALSEPELSRRVYQLAFELIRNNPWQTVQGAFFNWRMLFSDTLYGLNSYVAHENWNVNPIVNWTLYLLSIVGIYSCVRDIRNPVKSLILTGAVGIFLSIPFAPPIDTFRMRQFAASILILGVIPALGLGYLLHQTKVGLFTRPGSDKSLPSVTIGFTIVLVLATLLGPPVIKFTSSKISFEPPPCTTEPASIVIRLDGGTFINLQEVNWDSIDWAPNFHVSLFRVEAHSLSENDIINWAQGLRPSSTLFMTLDRIRNYGVLVVMPTKIVPEPGKYVQLCGRFDESPQLLYIKDVFYAEKVIPLSQ